MREESTQAETTKVDATNEATTNKKIIVIFKLLPYSFDGFNLLCKVIDNFTAFSLASH
jgi:hypothetical protein